MPFDHIRAEAKAGRMRARLMAIVAEGPNGRIYLPPTAEHEAIAAEAQPQDIPETDLPEQALGFRVQLYGMTKHSHLFTSRQLVALTTFSNLVNQVREQIRQSALVVGMPEDEAATYAIAVTTYLAFAVDKGANLWSTISSWMSDRGAMRETFARQTLSMVWDFAEANPFSDSGGNISMFIERITNTIEFIPDQKSIGLARQADAAENINYLKKLLISTDPPYYDNIGYADLSDFFYIWLRRSLGLTYPDLFSTLLVPKAPELVATPYRFGGDKQKAQQFFEQGLGQAFVQMRHVAHLDYPVTVYYAFKQAETTDAEDDTTQNPKAKIQNGAASTGWETMLDGLVQANFTITGTWPMRTEGEGRIRNIGSNALASSIVLVCRPRPEDAPITTRRDFLRLLKQELPAALRDLQRGNIAPVDLAQASIGPGMAIFSRHKGVLEADGSPMRVRTALALINQALDEYLAEQEGEYDADTRWALAWYEQFAFNEGPFGDAETLSKAKNTSVGGMVEAGILAARGGKVRLIKREELREDWDPTGDARLTVWEVAQYLIHTLDKRGESGTADLLSRVPPGPAEAARDLAYRLYTLCERKGWAGEALPYNSLVVAWPEIARLAGEIRRSRPVQRDFGF